MNEETKNKIRLSHLGKKFTAESKKRMSESHKKNYELGYINPRKGSTHTESAKEKNRKAHLGKPSPWKGKHPSKETLEKMRKAKLGKIGKNSNNWRGGITPEHMKIRHSNEYKLWRESVFKRDKYTCIWCGAKNKKGLGKTIILNADHIKPFALYPELRFAIDNGRTLCHNCHKTTDTYGLSKLYRRKR